MNDLKGIIEDVEKSSLVSDKVVKKVIEIIGQEKWNDIYDEEDDTCTTTGELIITLKGIAELEKENAELKEKYAKNITDCDICDTYCNSQLTKAKFLLKQLVDAFPKSYSDVVKDTLDEARKFVEE